MACEFSYNAIQTIGLNDPLLLNTSIPCTKGYVYHEDETGNFILRGIVNNPCNNFAEYKVTFIGNIAITEGGDITPIAVAIVVNGEPRVISRAISSPTIDGEYNNVTSSTIIKVPRGCCFNISVEYVSAVTGAVVATPSIDVQNANLTISRIA